MEQILVPAPGTSHLTAEDSALHLFQIAALLLGDEQAAVALVEETVAGVETDPCAEATLAYAEARTLLVHTAVRQIAGRHPEEFSSPAAPLVDAACIETDDLAAAILAGEQVGNLIAAAGRAGLRQWLEQLPPALRTVFVLRAIAGQDAEQTAESLRQSGAPGAQEWRRDQVGSVYRQALCSLASGLMQASIALVPA